MGQSHDIFVMFVNSLRKSRGGGDAMFELCFP